MDTNLARWLRIKRIEKIEVLQLHRLECEADVRWSKWMVKARGQSPQHWTEIGVSFMAQMDRKYGSFWGKKSEESIERIVEEFRRIIYPIWAPFFQQAVDGDLTDLEAMHKSDDQIFADENLIIETDKSGRYNLTEKKRADIDG